MAKNNLTPKQDLLTRDFYEQIAMADNVLDNSPAHKRQLRAIILEILNYDQIGPTTFVEKGQNMTVGLGKRLDDKYPDEWVADKEAAEAAVYDEINNTRSTYSSTSK